jgi:streptomycin 6-kinase
LASADQHAPFGGLVFAPQLELNGGVTLEIPEAFVINISRLGAMKARVWLNALPETVRELCLEWSLTLDGVAMHGGMGLVVPVRRGDEGLVLKLSYPNDLSRHEADALRAWNGRGAVLLHAYRPERDALLLERLDSRRSLKNLPLEAMLPIAGGLLRQLAIPAPSETPRLIEFVTDFVSSLNERWVAHGRPFPETLCERVGAIALELIADAGQCLVHRDLWDDNVLAGTRAPWLAIDPMVIAGDVEFGLAQILWRRLDEMTGKTDLRRALETLVDAANLEPGRALGWTLVRCVDYWLWGLSIGLTEDPARCQTIIEWLL